MGKRSDRDREGQPQGQPPWASWPPPPGRTPTRYPAPGSPPAWPSPAGQRGAPPSGHEIPQVQARPRPRRRKPSRNRNAVLLILAAVVVLGALAIALGGNGNSPKTAAVAATADSSASASPKAITAEDACHERPASADIYVRAVTPGVSPKARRIGGEWGWDHATSKCLASVQYAMATAPLSAGHCTQAGYVADNPGYDVNATAAPPLAHVAAQAGPACRAAERPAPARTTPVPSPVQTTPAAPPAQTTPAAPPASTAPASCYPISDEGTCYEPGEYCRDDDHGMSGVAGDGEAIICEDNDGWRWEPA